MKRVGKPRIEMIKPVLLYADDISELYNIFERGCERVEIEAADYQMEGPFELKNLNDDVISKLHIEGWEPFVSLHFEPDGVSLFIDEDSHQQIGIFEELKIFVNTRRRKLSWLTQSPIGPGILGGLTFQYIPTTKDELNTYSVLLVISMFAVAIFWFWWSLHSSQKKHTIIYTKKKRSKESFILRKKDDLYLALVSALIGAAITLLVTKVFL